MGMKFGKMSYAANSISCGSSLHRVFEEQSAFIRIKDFNNYELLFYFLISGLRELRKK
jgi:hypothetical protein